MKTFRLILTALMVTVVTTVAFSSCDDQETYSDMRKRENRSIDRFLKNGACVIGEDGDTLLYVPPIKRITEAQFYAQDSTTNVAENEYVLINSTGIYMQIVNKGPGRKIEHDENTHIIARYLEYNVQGDSIQTRNNNLYFLGINDVFAVSNNYGVFTASFLSGVMKGNYGTSSVPEGWLVPLTFINPGRYDAPEQAHVRVLVPSTSGSTSASTNVYATFYDLEYVRGR